MARSEDGVSIGPTSPTKTVCDLTFATPCKWDRVRRWVLRALGKPKGKLDIYPVDKPVATDVDPLPVSAPRAAPASALAFAPSAAPDAAPSARLTLAEFKTIHEPGNIYVGNVVSAYPGFCCKAFRPALLSLCPALFTHSLWLLLFLFLSPSDCLEDELPPRARAHAHTRALACGISISVFAFSLFISFSLSPRHRCWPAAHPSASASHTSIGSGFLPTYWSWPPATHRLRPRVKD